MLQSLTKKYPNRLQLFGKSNNQPAATAAGNVIRSTKKKKKNTIQKLSLDGAILGIQDLYARMSVGTGPQEKDKSRTAGGALSSVAGE